MKWVFKKILFLGQNSGQSQNRKAFTLIEVTVALIVFGMIAATVLVVINKAIETVVLWQTKMQAFEITRENMEKILAQSSVTDFVEYGMSETNPDITWETTVSSFYEPLTDQMWMRAVCTAQFVDSEGEEQKIELTHWLTSLNQEQIRQILEQKQRESEYQAAMGTLLNESSESVGQQGQLLAGQQANQLQQQADHLQEQADQLREQAKQPQTKEQAEQLQHQAEQLQQKADQLQQKAEQQQQAEQMQQQQAEEPQNQQDSDAQSWKEIESLIGPPPAGYNSWKDVPLEQFWGAMMK
ncbi:MAG: type II secretion system protein [Phycisphaerae bacterium]|nr:type II secretion system protein [Phycisphaerae bacterium]